MPEQPTVHAAVGEGGSPGGCTIRARCWCAATRGSRSGVPLDLGSTVCIDTGVYDSQGWLTCLHVETGGYWQANQRGETRTGSLGANVSP